MVGTYRTWPQVYSISALTIFEPTAAVIMPDRVLVEFIKMLVDIV